MRRFNKEEKIELNKFMNVCLIAISSISFVNIVIAFATMSFIEYKEHVYFQFFTLLFIGINLFVFFRFDTEEKLEKMWNYFILLAIYLTLGAIDTIKLYPEIVLMFFIPYLIAFNIFYANKATLLMATVTIIIAFLIITIDYIFHNHFWTNKNAIHLDELYFNIAINLTLNLIFSIVLTYFNFSFKYNKPTQEIVNNDNHLKSLYEKILVHLEENEPYLDKNYNLKLLASEINSNAVYVSNAINDIGKQSYNNLINNFRIEGLKREMIEDSKLDKKKFTLEYYYNKYGFKNQSTFNKAFKQNTGITPTEYLTKFNRFI